VSLSELLNALDGVGAQAGRLVVMTTNAIDQLDEALV
jgi:chaperone BCS1